MVWYCAGLPTYSTEKFVTTCACFQQVSSSLPSSVGGVAARAGVMVLEAVAFAERQTATIRKLKKPLRMDSPFLNRGVRHRSMFGPFDSPDSPSLGW